MPDGRLQHAYSLDDVGHMHLFLELHQVVLVEHSVFFIQSQTSAELLDESTRAPNLAVKIANLGAAPLLVILL